MTGYSGTPLSRKLGIRPGSSILLRGAPDGFLELLAPLPDGVTFLPELGPGTDLLHVFATSRSELDAVLPAWRREMDPDATIWVSWPKRASRVPTDLTENVVREVALPLGLVDVKVCAVDDTWSGLELVVRKQLR